MNTINKFLMTLPVCIILGGCSGEPSENEIAEAIETSLHQQMEVMPGVLKGMGEPKIHSIAKVGDCEELKNGYRCTVDMDATIPMVGRQKGVTPMTFIESDDGWKVLNEN